MASERLYPRYLMHRLEEALGDTPVVVLHGPRQCGKTTVGFGGRLFAAPIRTMWETA